MISTEKAKNFIFDHARPLEKSLYDCYIENKGKEAALSELSKFQNSDGGFGHALELDNWNPNSNPIATNDALITLQRLDAMEDAEEMIQGMMRYIGSRESFDEEKRKWLFAIDSNKDYPHAIWWEKDGDGVDKGYNPTVSLATLMICRKHEKGNYYTEIVRDAFSYLEKEPASGDGLKCYMLSYRLLSKYHQEDIIDLHKAKKLITQRIADVICKDTEKYGVEYVAVPSDFYVDGDTDFLTDEIRDLIRTEQNILNRLQKDDGGFDISWQWWTSYQDEFELARTFWRARITIDKLLFVQNYTV